MVTSDCTKDARFIILLITAIFGQYKYLCRVYHAQALENETELNQRQKRMKWRERETYKFEYGIVWYISMCVCDANKVLRQQHSIAREQLKASSLESVLQLKHTTYRRISFEFHTIRFPILFSTTKSKPVYKHFWVFLCFSFDFS